MLIRFHLIRMIAMVVLSLLPIAVAGELRAVKLRTGRALERALEIRRAVRMQAVPIRTLVTDLQEQAGICIVVDRRIDPSQRLTINTGLISTEDLLRQVAAELPAANISVNRSFVYIGPIDASRRLRTLCEQKRLFVLDARREFGKEAYAKLSKVELQTWGEFISPRNLVMEFSENAGLKIVNPDAIPHDLWHAAQLSAMPFTELATLVLTQFDLTFDIDPTKVECTIIPVPEVVLLERRHSVPSRRRGVAEKQLMEAFGELEAQWERSAVLVHATYEQHEQIAVLLSGKDPAKGPLVMNESLKTRLFTLSLPNGVTWRALMSQLHKSGVVIRAEADLAELLDQKVSGDFKRLPGTQFFRQLFHGLPVEVEVRDKEVVLRPADRDD